MWFGKGFHLCMDFSRARAARPRPSRSGVIDDVNPKIRWWRLPSARPLPSAATETRFARLSHPDSGRTLASRCG